MNTLFDQLKTDQDFLLGSRNIRRALAAPRCRAACRRLLLKRFPELRGMTEGQQVSKLKAEMAALRETLELVGANL